MKKMIIMSALLLMQTSAVQAQNIQFPVPGCASSRWIGSPLPPVPQLKEELNQVSDADPALKMKRTIQLAHGWFALGNIVEGESLMASIQQQAGGDAALPDALMGQSLAYQAELALCRKEFDKARQYYLQAIKFYEKSGNANAPLISVLLNLAGFYYQQGRFAEGEAAFERADALSAAGSKMAPKEVQWVDRQLVEFWRKGNVPAAMTQARAVVEKLEAEVASLQQKVAQLASDFEAKYNASVAEPVNGGKMPSLPAEAMQKKIAAQGAWRAAKSELRQRQYRLALADNAHGELLHAQHKYAEAEAVYLRALAQLTQIEWDKSVAGGRILSDLGLLYRATGVNDKAQAHQIRALEVLVPIYGAEHPDVMEAEAELAFLRKQATQPEPLPERGADKSSTRPADKSKNIPVNKAADKAAQKAQAGK